MLTSGTGKNVVQLSQGNGGEGLDKPIVMLISVWAGLMLCKCHTCSKYILTHLINFSKVLLAIDSLPLVEVHN